MITHLHQVTAAPLCWPENKPREAQRVDSPFKITSVAKALEEIRAELARWRAVDYVISMTPLYMRGPSDPGVALWWIMPTGRQNIEVDLRVLACDRYRKPEANGHAIALTLTGLRAFERYGTYTKEQAIEGARLALPGPEIDRVDWPAILGVGRDWPVQAVRLAYTTKAEKAHPDRGGSTEEITRINGAWEAAKRELGAE